jgi:hypothetical protein
MGDSRNPYAVAVHPVHDSIVAHDEFAYVRILVFGHNAAKLGKSFQALDGESDSFGEIGGVGGRIFSDVGDDLVEGVLLPHSGFPPLCDTPFDLFMGNCFPRGEFLESAVNLLPEVQFVHDVFNCRLLRHPFDHLEHCLFGSLGHEFLAEIVPYCPKFVQLPK